MKYAKAIVAVLGAVLVSVLSTFPDSQAVQQWGAIISALVTAVGVYVVPNLTEQPAPEPKPYVSGP